MVCDESKILMVHSDFKEAQIYDMKMQNSIENGV